jgi:hypothetical protein
MQAGQGLYGYSKWRESQPRKIYKRECRRRHSARASRSSSSCEAARENPRFVPDLKPIELRLFFWHRFAKKPKLQYVARVIDLGAGVNRHGTGCGVSATTGITGPGLFEKQEIPARNERRQGRSCA